MQITRSAGAVGLVLATTFGIAACSGSGDGGGSHRAVELAASSDTDLPIVRVGGEGTVDGTPDVMTISLGVETVGESAQSGLQTTNEKAAALIETLKQNGVAAKDIKTVVDAEKKRIGSGVVVIVLKGEDGKGTVAIGVTEDLTGKYAAGTLIKSATAALGGQGGGGRPDMAQGGGPDASKAEDAVAAIRALI